MTTNVVILAAGKGVRMNSDRPKVLVELAGRPLIAYLLDAVKHSGLCDRPTIVVGSSGEMVRQVLGDRYQYIQQEQQRGTGHALRACASVLEGVFDNILVLYGDHPFVTPQSIISLANTHGERGGVMTMMTATVADFTGWHSAFDDFGRIVRDESGCVLATVEKKDAAPDVSAIREVNTGIYCFQSRWLWPSLVALTDDNAAKEYLLTDLVAMAIAGGHTVTTIPIDPQEAFGINTPEQLRYAEAFLKRP